MTGLAWNYKNIFINNKNICYYLFADSAMESAFLLACSLLPLAEACNQSNQGLIATAHALQAGTAGRKKKQTRARPGLHPGETCGPVQDWETDEPKEGTCAGMDQRTRMEPKRGHYPLFKRLELEEV
jgi:hypothetical protein